MGPFDPPNPFRLENLPDGQSFIIIQSVESWDWCHIAVAHRRCLPVTAGATGQACKTFKTSCQQEFPWKISFQIFVEKLDPTPLLNAKLIRFGQLIHENPAFYKKKYFWPRNNLCLIRRISKGNYS